MSISQTVLEWEGSVCEPRKELKWGKLEKFQIEMEII